MKKTIKLKLSAGEKLLLDRRRRGETQRDAAEAYAVTLYQFRRWELGEGEGVPDVSLGDLEPHEICFIYRQRDGMSLEDLGAMINRTPCWISQIEKGDQPVDVVEHYWRTRRRKKIFA